jgi:hypothetical protein
MLTLNEQHMADLKAFINKIPTEFGLPLLTFSASLSKSKSQQKRLKQKIK